MTIDAELIELGVGVFGIAVAIGWVLAIFLVFRQGDVELGVILLILSLAGGYELIGRLWQWIASGRYREVTQ